ncbi:MAG: T9SS type A sorting domain-containing protein [Bacteroidaceae bacterium]|nr:T9SS type A sorting domain-containing protein [Bacteroidaceae bacterium]
MKKLLLFLITAATLTTTATAQNLVINGKDGSTTDLNLESLRKITFSKGNLVARYSDGTYSEYALSTIGKLAFETGTGLSSIEIMDGHLAYSSQSGTAFVTNSQGSDLIVYNISGRIVLKQSIQTDAETIDLSALQEGIYLLRLNGITVKIRK